MYTTQKQIRKAFWQYLKETSPEIYAKGKRSKPQDDQPTDVRVSFCNFVDHLQKSGEISEKLAWKVTL